MIPKFRAWDKIHKKLGLIDADILSGQLESVKIFDDDNDDWQAVDNFILMQSTGFKDKNGVEIFDGDVVKYILPHQLLISVFKINRARSGVWRMDNAIYGRELWEANLEKFEVIGNIYENPELLKELNNVP